MSDAWKAPGLSPDEADLYGLNKYPPISWDQVLLSFEGRIPRRTWWLYYSVGTVYSLLCYGVFLTALMTNEFHSLFLMLGLVASQLPTLWSGWAICAKRWHDLNWSGWWTVPCIVVPVVGPLVLLVVLGGIRGTSGRNEYGPGPVFR